MAVAHARLHWEIWPDWLRKPGINDKSQVTPADRNSELDVSMLDLQVRYCRHVCFLLHRRIGVLPGSVDASGMAARLGMIRNNILTGTCQREWITVNVWQ